MNTINLTQITKKPVFAKLLFEAGFDTISGVYFPSGSIDLLIYHNNLKGGYIGNTLMTEYSPGKLKSFTNTDIRIDKLIFSKCQLIVSHESEKYCLHSNYNYLVLKADFVKNGKISEINYSL